VVERRGVLPRSTIAAAAVGRERPADPVADVDVGAAVVHASGGVAAIAGAVARLRAAAHRAGGGEPAAVLVAGARLADVPGGTVSGRRATAGRRRGRRVDARVR